MASSSSSSLIRTCKYRVFVSFHGKDVRKTFVSHLRKQFKADGHTVYDDQGMERGETIGPALMQAISESRISIVVLSKNYASSGWCLDELLEIFKCKKYIGQIVMTVFYGVDPSDVRYKTKDFGNAFNETCARKKDEEKRKNWSKALEDVGNIAGEDSQKWDDESKMIEKISRDVSNKLLNSTISSDSKDNVGIKAHLQKMQSLLKLDYKDGVMIVGICGPAGIGKTTIARALHSCLSSNFQLNCFMENMRGSSNSGLDEEGFKLQLQKQLLSKILNQDSIRVDNLSALPTMLQDKKVLIILDDVDNLKQLQALADKTNWFGPGSRIIITTEDRELLKKHDINNTYHVAFPTEEEARMIFCRYAFRKSSKPDGFEKLIERVTKLCGKLPLGLRLMGSYLCSNTKDDWEDILQGLENNLELIESDIDKVLRLGYDSLPKTHQLLFLLIAVFFNYKDDGHVIDMLAGKNLINVTRLGLKTLEDKSLIQKSIEGNIVMHKLLQQMGRKEIQSQKPWQRQILIDTNDIREFLTNKSDFKSVIGISLDISTIQDDVNINARAFEKEQELRFIRFQNEVHTNVRMHVPEDMHFPPCLRLFHWDAYPIQHLPHTFTPQFLVELNLSRNNLEKLWEGIQPLTKLRKIDLFGSTKLKELPDLSKAKNLEMLKVGCCWSLVELPPSIANLHKLEQLKVDLCVNLQSVPTLFHLESLYDVDMSGCDGLRNFPDISLNITKLAIADTMLEKVPESIRFCRVKHFRIIGTTLDGAEKIPDWMKDLHQLEELYLRNCRKLASLPELPASLRTVIVDTCKSLETLIPFPVDSAIRVLYFINCFKLDGEARRVITHKPSKACLPGKTIPAKFKQQDSGNSLTIRSDFKDFMICVVVSPNQRVVGSRLQGYATVLCDIRINGCPIEKDIGYVVSMIETEHLYTSFVSFSDEDEGWREQDNEILFKFSTTYTGFDIIQCGVRTMEDMGKSKLQQLSEVDHESLSDGSHQSCSEQLYEDDDESLSDDLKRGRKRRRHEIQGDGNPSSDILQER